MASKEIRFNIKGTTPHILPMVRLADYLRKLATVLGSEERVHFLKMEEGSAPAVIELDEEIMPDVVSRTRNATIGKGPKEAVQACASLREFLEEDALTAQLEGEQGEVIAKFALPRKREQDTVGPLWQEGSLDGLLTRIEGVDQTIHVTLVSENSRHLAEASREIGVQLGPRFYKTVRVFGKGRWYRNAEGRWELQRFIIGSIEDLEDISLPEIVTRLRAIPDNNLLTLEDPIAEMLRIRRGEE